MALRWDGARALKALLLLIAAVGLLAAVHAMAWSGLYLSPVRIALLVAFPLAVACAALLLLLARPATQLLALLCGAAALIAVFGAELYLEIEAARSPAAGWTPWERTAEVPYPQMCGKYVMVMDPDGKVRSALQWRGQEVQPVAGIAANPFGGGTASDEHGFVSPPGNGGVPRAGSWRLAIPSLPAPTWSPAKASWTCCARGSGLWSTSAAPGTGRCSSSPASLSMGR